MLERFINDYKIAFVFIIVYDPFDVAYNAQHQTQALRL
jgi:hypothetical protein